MFILNKGLSLSPMILIGLNFALGPAKNLGLPVSPAWLNARKALGMGVFLFILIQALMSFILFTPRVFAKMFAADGTLTGPTGISMLAGVLGFVVLWGYNLSFQTNLREDKAFIGFITSRKFLNWALPLGGAHVFFMGYASWQGGLPPISLISFATFVVGYLLNFFGRE